MIADYHLLGASQNSNICMYFCMHINIHHFVRIYASLPPKTQGMFIYAQTHNCMPFFVHPKTWQSTNAGQNVMKG